MDTFLVFDLSRRSYDMYDMFCHVKHVRAWCSCPKNMLVRCVGKGTWSYDQLGFDQAHMQVGPFIKSKSMRKLPFEIFQVMRARLLSLERNRTL